MICEHCAWEADAVKNGDFTHKELKSLNKTFTDVQKMGHAACKGGGWCDCHHKKINWWEAKTNG